MVRATITEQLKFLPLLYKQSAAAAAKAAAAAAAITIHIHSIHPHSNKQQELHQYSTKSTQHYTTTQQ